MSTDFFRKYLDLLNEAETRVKLVANQPVIPGQPLSPVQMAVVDIARSMGNQMGPEVDRAYDLAKQAGIKPGPGVSDQSSLASGSDLIAPNTNVALPSSGTFSNDDAIANLNRQMTGGSVPRCAVCGTPQSQHQQLKHQFVAGGAADRPDPVPQPQTAGGGDVGRIKKLQAELKAAGADLGATGVNRDGIDGDIGPLTRAAMTQYPDIVAKYADLSSAQASTPEPTPPKVVVDTSKVTAALVAIEKILDKYKRQKSVTESAPPLNQLQYWRQLVEYSEINEAPRGGQGAFSNISNTLQSAQPPYTTSTGGTATPSPSGQTHTASPSNPNIATPAAAPAAAAAAPAAAAAAPAAAAAAPAGTLSKLWKQAKGLAGKAALPLNAGMAILDGYKQIKALDTNMPQDQYRAAVSKIVARLVSEYGLFWVGSILGGILGGAIAGPGALVGFIAGGAGGLALDYALGDSAGAITDKMVDYFYGTGGSSMSAEDQASIKENMAIIQDFVKNNANLITPDMQTRIDAVTKAVKSSETQPAPPVQPVPTTPAQSSTPAAREAAVQDTLNRLDALLKTQTFESIKVESLSEQLARHRDIVNEGFGSRAWTKAGAEAAALAKSSKAYAQARQVIMNSGLTGKQLNRELDKVMPQVFAAEKSVTEMASDMLITVALKLGLTVGGLGIVGAVGYGGYQALKYYNAPKTMSAAEQAEFNQLRAKLSELVPDVAALNSLSPALQQEYADFVDQLEAIEARTKKPQGTK